MKLAVVGTGYVGLVAGVCFAESGHDVVCVDVVESKVEKLRTGVPTIYEPGLEEMLKRNIRLGRIRFSTSLVESMTDVQFIFLAVPTPQDEDGSADLQHVVKVAELIGEHLKDYKVIVNKSTVPVGTADKVTATIRSKTQSDFDVVSNPEFLKEGDAIKDFMKPDRIVVGADTERATKLMRKLYDPFVRTGAPILCMDVKSAEMTKYVSNAMLATKISFMNEMSRICDKVGANINVVRKAVGADRRIGTSFLFPGAGYGGSCFPKDVRAIEKTGLKNGVAMHIMQAVTLVNEEQKKVLTEKILARMGKDLKGKKIAVWGLSFKPQTDDMREAPSIVTISDMLAAGAEVVAYDPQAMEESREHYLKDSITYAPDMYSALEGADALILMTEWTVFRSPDFKSVKDRMKGNLIFDGRNIFDREEIEENGLEYFGIGC